VRRIAVLALSVWIAVFASIALFTLFWRIGYVRPHVLWGLLSLAATLIPLAWLAVSALWRSVRGPGRLRAFGWLLVGATPVVWIGAYVTQLIVDTQTRTPRTANAPVRVVAVSGSSIFDVEARWRYPSWTRGRHAVLIDDGRSPSPEKLVAHMDRHIEAMADLLGQPVPDKEFRWVRGSLFGFNGRAVFLWAICIQEDAGELTFMDRHEVAHTLITALSGPDQDPPCLFTEGWAESQSENRDDQIQFLAKAHREAWAYSLQELVAPAAYEPMGPGGWAYWEGGPVVHYLMHRYGPATFFRLYSGVRRDSFRDNCRAILGDSWETVEEDFWKWIESEDTLLARAPPKPPAAPPAGRVELAKSVNSTDWQTLVESCREANKDFEPLPSNAAFVFKGEKIEKKADVPGSDNRTEYEFSAVFEGQQFWIFDNYYRPDGDSFLMATPARNADLIRDKSGSFQGKVKGAWPRERAVAFMAFCRREGNPANLLPLRGNSVSQGTCRIERLVRPREGTTGKWKVWFTRRYAKDEPEVRYQIELDPGRRWRITRTVGEMTGRRRFESNSEYENLGDV